MAEGSPRRFRPLSEVEPSVAPENETDVETSLKTPGPNPPATPANETTLSAAQPVARPIAYRTTKTEVLNLAKAGTRERRKPAQYCRETCGRKQRFSREPAGDRPDARSIHQSGQPSPENGVNPDTSKRAPSGPTTPAARGGPSIERVPAHAAAPAPTT